MANDELLTDDYVAGLLSKEANDCSLKYSAMGMEAYRQEKKCEKVIVSAKGLLLTALQTGEYDAT